MKVDMPGSVNQIEFVFFSFMHDSHGDGAGFNRNTSLPLKLHIIENLLLHLAFLNCAGMLEHAISQGTLAMIDVRDNAKVSNIFGFDFGHAVVNLTLG